NRCGMVRIRPASLVVALAITFASLTSRTSAQTSTWSGLGANNLWNTSANWQGSVVPVSSSTAAIVLTGNTQTSNVLNLGAFSLNSLTCGSEAGPSRVDQDLGDLFSF